MNAPYFQDERVTLHHAECLTVLRALPDCSVDSVVTDPPYGLAEHKRATVETALRAWLSGDREHVPDGRGFMGNDWDRFVPPPAVWDECMRVLKPGGHLLAFAGARTVDLMGTSIRLAGLTPASTPRVTDMIAWLNAQGVPKAQGVLKPAFEPVIVTRKPTTADITASPGVGRLNVDACRIAAKGRQFIDFSGEVGTRDVYGRGSRLAVAAGRTDSGRWPPNVALDAATAAELDRAAGARLGRAHGESTDGRRTSRYFPVFKYEPKAMSRERPRGTDGRGHPTVKPVDLMRWLVRLATPPGGVVLEPFAGSGTTIEACLLEGMRCIAIEREVDYLPLIMQRIDRSAQGNLFLGEEPA